MFLFSAALNIIFTVILLIVYVGLAFIINKAIAKRQETNKKGIFWFYILLFFVFVGFAGLILWFFGLDYSSQINNIWTSISDNIGSKIGAIAGTIITFFIATLIIKVSTILLKRASLKEGPNKKRMTTMLKVVKSIIRYSIEIVAILITLALWGVDVLPAIAGLGILGLVVGLGAQSMINDFIAGFFIIFEHQFDVGDVVEINGFKGEVIDIGLKSSRFRNWKGDVKIMTNGTIKNVTNYSLTNSVAVIEFGISYSEDIEKTISILNKELPKYREIFPEIIENPVILGVTALADSSVNITVIVKTDTEKHYAIERAIRKGIKEILDKNNIEIPFPQIVVHKSE
ncbi:MAG: mechanosensitive ion channel family protein [Tenericutes bacterium]|nr:mechanosensitive ion channel family protein [Mycoplasmatota bacterium]